MNVLLCSIDSLSRHFLDAYGGSVEFDVDTRNLDRFADRAAVFDTHYAGSLPCMPARREWLAGIQEFLWRPWGPIEPFDAPLPRTLRDEGVPTQLITDHYHYFQHGSGGYFEDFNGYEFVRGHEYDPWKTSPRDPEGYVRDQLGFSAPDEADGVGFMDPLQYSRNVDGFEDESEYFAPKVFSRTAEWLRRNREWDEWFCYVDSFDVHEPFHVPEPYASMYTDEDPRDPELTHWPFYGSTEEGQSELTDRELAFVRSQFAGKLTMVDRWFGRVLDALEDCSLWEETIVIVTADHGHYLGEHDWIGKPFEAPLYDVLARTPLMIWHPESDRVGDRIDALTAAVDLYPTIREAFDAPIPDGTHGRSLEPLLLESGDRSSVREWAIYGYWGSSVNVTDGEYTYLHPCDDEVDSYCHSTTMMNPHSWFTPPEPRPNAEAGNYLPYADAPVWRYESASYSRHEEPLLFDVTADPEQREDLAGTGDPNEERLRGLLVDALAHLEAPSRQYERLGLEEPSDAAA
ncbi:sulfatase-like hydrolase/transferase [Halomontanus rarus]|uniref:sulfatase-like hydrolase/transferase n=1 Tax=Halomontanus rarus TaxID=3034020 RepID=UPI0023E7C2D8|nr:sulfatase-like hydrolase/transferase [Halovivax sp. TS33]